MKETNYNSIFTIHVAEQYREFSRTLFAVLIILLVFHVLMSGQNSTGLIGGLFNRPFSETLSKILVAIAFYYLVSCKIIRIV